MTQTNLKYYFITQELQGLYNSEVKNIPYDCSWNLYFCL